MKLNDFKVDLEYSLLAGENEMFDLFYKRVFPGLARIEFVRDMKLQRLGIDKILHFETGQRISIDEKKRRLAYNDILLELWSVKEKGIKGWLFTSHCQYIVYAIMPLKKVYLLPLALLRLAYEHNKWVWERNPDSFKKARNVGYTTVSIAVPSGALLNAISNEMSKQLVDNTPCNARDTII